MRLLVLSAVAISAALSTVVFVLDFADGIDARKAKPGIKASVKGGGTAFQGYETDSTQDQNIFGAIIGTVILLVTVAGIHPIVRSRRIHKRTKTVLGVLGIVLGMGLIIPMRLVISGIIKLII